MFLSYDPEGDVLEVVFDESLHRAEQVAYKLRQGMVLYVTTGGLKPVQLTIVNYRALAQFPVIHFDEWQALPLADKKSLQPLFTSPPISNFLKLDPETGYGHFPSPAMPEILAIAA